MKKNILTIKEGWYKVNGKRSYVQKIQSIWHYQIINEDEISVWKRLKQNDKVERINN